MKRSTIISAIAVFSLAVFAIVLTIDNPNNSYTPRIKQIQGISGYQSYLKSIRANQNTGFVSNEDVSQVIDEISLQGNKKFKSDWPLKWEFRGPDNLEATGGSLLIQGKSTQLISNSAAISIGF